MHLPTSSTVARHTRTAIALHWAIAVLLLAQFALGWWMLGVPKSPPGVRAGWFNVHKSLGILIAVAVLARMAWRASHREEDLAAMPAWQRIASQITHGLLYACMLVMPVTGLAGSMFTRYPIKFFGVTLPLWHREWPVAKELMSDVHDAVAWTFVALIALHVAAALWHWWLRDGIAARMGIPSLSSR